MAGHRHRDRVGGTRTGNRARRTGCTDPLSDLAVGRGPAGGDVAERLPDAPLECRAPEIPLKIEAVRRGSLDQIHHGRRRPVELGAGRHERRSGETALKVVHKEGGIVAEKDGADAVRASPDQDGSQRRRSQRDCDSISTHLHVLPLEFTCRNCPSWPEVYRATGAGAP
jgi:hypothetical protein